MYRRKSRRSARIFRLRSPAALPICTRPMLTMPMPITPPISDMAGERLNIPNIAIIPPMPKPPAGRRTFNV